jgi:hypothetical protein
MEGGDMAARRSAARLRVVAALPALAALLALFATGCGATVVTGDAGAGTGSGTPTTASTPAVTATGTTGGGDGQQTPPVSGPHGTLSVDVVAGPTCPVEQAENPCPPVRVAERPVTIVTPAGAVVATATTDAQGHFSIVLTPGAYVIQVAIVPGAPGLRQDSPGNVTVVDGQTTSVQIMLDTGIR